MQVKVTNMTARDTMRMGQLEFIALLAMLFATIAFSIDAMLPALPEIAQELSPNDVNRAQLILTSFVLGMGIGTFVAGPLSDTFGRKAIITLGAVLYCGGAFIAWSSSSLEVVLAARILQGLGAAGPRVVGLAIIRDLYEGRGMARVMSFVMMVFTLFPALAPLIGTLIIEIANWRAIFIVFIGFSIFTMIWLHLRLHETLPKEKRRPFRVSVLFSAILELFSHRTVRISIACQTLGFGMLFGMISSIQQIYEVTFDRSEVFPIWFAVIGIFSGSASFLNAMLVMRLGMRKMVVLSFMGQAIISAAMIALSVFTPSDAIFFGVFLIWQTSIFFMAGLVFGNLNALAMEPVGHIAGLAASLIGGVATVLATSIAAPVGLLFDGSPLPLAIMTFIASAIAAALMLWMVQREAAEIGSS